MIQLTEEQQEKVIALLRDALAPMVPYHIDPLEFCREAHDIKDKLVSDALAILTGIPNG